MTECIIVHMEINSEVFVICFRMVMAMLTGWMLKHVTTK